jgi:hypothetical protein
MRLAYPNRGAIAEIHVATLDRRIFARLHLRRAVIFPMAALPDSRHDNRKRNQQI